MWQAGYGQLESHGGRRIEAFLLWRKAWAAGREPEAADITVILGTGLQEVGGSLREWAELPGAAMEGLRLAQKPPGHLKESQALQDQGASSHGSKDSKKVYRVWEVISLLSSLLKSWDGGWEPWVLSSDEHHDL